MTMKNLSATCCISKIYPVRVEVTENQGWEQYGGEIEYQTRTEQHECNFYKSSFDEWGVGQIKQIGE